MKTKYYFFLLISLLFMVGGCEKEAIEIPGNPTITINYLEIKNDNAWNSSTGYTIDGQAILKTDGYKVLQAGGLVSYANTPEINQCDYKFDGTIVDNKVHFYGEWGGAGHLSWNCRAYMILSDGRIIYSNNVYLDASKPYKPQSARVLIPQD